MKFIVWPRYCNWPYGENYLPDGLTLMSNEYPPTWGYRGAEGLVLSSPGSFAGASVLRCFRLSEAWRDALLCEMEPGRLEPLPEEILLGEVGVAPGARHDFARGSQGVSDSGYG